MFGLVQSIFGVVGVYLVISEFWMFTVKVFPVSGNPVNQIGSFFRIFIFKMKVSVFVSNVQNVPLISMVFTMTLRQLRRYFAQTLVGMYKHCLL